MRPCKAVMVGILVVTKIGHGLLDSSALEPYHSPNVRGATRALPSGGR